MIKIGYFWYDTEDRIMKCPKCGHWMYDDPVQLRYLKLTHEEKVEAMLGTWGIAVCPYCFYVTFYGAVPKRFLSPSKPE